SSGKAKSAVTSLPSWRSSHDQPDDPARGDARGPDGRDPRARRRSERYQSLSVHRRGHHSTWALTVASRPDGGAAVTTEIFQPSRPRYLVRPAPRRPPTKPSGGK